VPPTGAQAQGVPNPTVAVPAVEPGALYLQVLASRDADPAREALLDLRAKGHSVTLDSSEAGWHRILIGPFHKQEEAAQYQLRLKTEGIDSFVRTL
jgi:cell division septation protein DedD